MEAERVSISLAKLVVVGSAMDAEMEAAEADGEAGAAVGGVVVAGGGAGADEACLEPNTRLSRALAPKVGGPWFLSS
jgi:hypothetical protein